MFLLVDKKRKALFGVVCFILVFIVFGPSLWGGFVFDDRSIVEHQGLFKNVNNLLKVMAMPYWSVESGLYRPTILASYVFNYSFFGQGAWSFHLLNLIFYALTGFLLFLLVIKLFKRKKLAYLTAILFLVLPIHAEVAANIVGRAEILALLFSLLVFLELAKEKSNPWKAGFWFLLAMASKEVAIAALPISALIIFYKKIYRQNQLFEKKENSLRVAGSSNLIARGLHFFSPLLVLFSSLAAYFTARFLTLGGNFLSNNATLVENPLKFVSWRQRIATALKILTMYLFKTVWPFKLCADYSYNQIPISNNFLNFQTIFGLLILLFLCFGIIIFLFRKPSLAFACAFILCAFIPISNLILPIGTIAGERLVYFASVGLCVFLAEGLLLIYKKFRLLGLMLAMSLIVFYSAASFVRGLDWLSEEALFVSSAQCAPNSVLSRSNLGAVYYLNKDYKRAEEEFFKAEKIYGGYAKAINNLGLVYWKMGEVDKAKKQFFKALSGQDYYVGAYENLALLALSQNNEKEARKWLVLFFNGNQKEADNYLRGQLFAQ